MVWEYHCWKSFGPKSWWRASVMMSKEWSMQEKKNQMDFIKIKIFYSGKDHGKREER